jgi:hypothetical protein
MKFRHTCRLLVAVCLLGAVIWVFELNLPSTEQRKESSGRVLDISIEDVSSLTMERENLHADCVNEDGMWFIKRPIMARADAGAVTRVLHEMEAMPVREVITAAQRKERELGLKDYGFDKPRIRLMTGDPRGKKELLVGGDAPPGDMLYVKLADSDDIMATSRSILDAVPSEIENLRDRSIVYGEPARTSRLEIQSKTGGFVQLLRKGRMWMIQQPELARADSGRVSYMLQSLYSLKVSRFICDPVVSPAKEQTVEAAAAANIQPAAKAEPYGLTDESAIRVKVWVQGDELGRGIVLGKPTGDVTNEVYAKETDNEAIYTVGKKILDIFTVTVADLKDRNLFSIEPDDVEDIAFQAGDKKVVLTRAKDSGWTIIDPVRWKADDWIVNELVRRITHLRIQSFVESSMTNLAELGLAPPAYSIGIGAGKSDTTGISTNRLLVGALIEGKSSVCMKFENENSIYEVFAGSMKGLETCPVDPLVCRDRTVLAIPPENIKTISLTKGAIEQTITRNTNGAWSVVMPPSNQVDTAVLEDMLLVVANLRALRIEASSPASVSAYGLDTGTIKLTMGLTGGEGIQKTILLGFLARTDGIYAMVHGQDVVFVLEKAIADRLTHDLTRPPAAEVKEETPAKGP